LVHVAYPKYLGQIA